jgi:hypothetical protein
LAWLAKVWWLVPGSHTWEDLFTNAAIGDISGRLVIFSGIVFFSGLILISLLTRRLHQATGEVLPRFGEEHPVLTGEEHPEAGDRMRAWFRLSRRRQQLLAIIITDEAASVSERILEELKRGVTAVDGTGMYTGQPHKVLLIALTITEVNHLKQVVSQADPRAFMVVSPAQEVLGRGFLPLEKKSI